MTRALILAMQLMAGVVMGAALLYVVLRYYALAHGISGDICSDAIGHAAVLVEPSEWEFGKVASGQKLQAEFKIRNCGDRRLILRKSGGSCDCFSARESEIIVEAGQSRNVAAEFDTSNAAGSLRIELNYRTNDPQHPLLKLFCLAEVQPG